jgi:ankyrin repeat protein
VEIVELLISRDADPNMANEQGGTALHWACVNGHAEVVTRLLEAGAKATLVNAGGRTALDEAMHNDRGTCVDAIMKASGVEEEEADFEDDIEVEGEEPEDQGPETKADR